MGAYSKEKQRGHSAWLLRGQRPNCSESSLEIFVPNFELLKCHPKADYRKRVDWKREGDHPKSDWLGWGYEKVLETKKHYYLLGD